MKRNARHWFAVLMMAASVLAPAAAQALEDGDKTLSPYFWVQSDDPEVDRLPLKSTSAQVRISGVIADVAVTQVYENQGQRPLEAIYVFPASTRAAVYGMKMIIGGRTVTAMIDKREAARRQYEQAKQQGRSASLLEQQRPNVFQMNVANILPGDVIKVELRYTELLIPTDAIYTFVYPTVVGPRYTGANTDDTDPSAGWTANPYLHEGDPPTYAFHIDICLSAGLPIREVSCASHRVNVRYEGPALARVGLDPVEAQGGNRDFLIKYRLAGGRIQTGLLLFEGEDENFFLLMVQPPERVSPTQIPPREYIFIVDVSGSMHGFPLDVSKRLLKELIGSLRPTDRFNVILFAGGSTLMAERSLPATPANVTRAMNVIDRQRGGGGTELLPALKRALALPGAEGCSRTVVIATDGYVSVEEDAFDLIRNRLGEANMFAFGIGSSVNRHLIEGMARVGIGEPFVVTRPEDAAATAAAFRSLIQSPVLTGIKVDFDGFDAYDVEPPSIPDVLAERPVLLFGKWKGRPKGTIRLSGRSGEGAYNNELNVDAYGPSGKNRALAYLWARHRIALLSDYNRLRADDGRVEEVTQLGLRYHLLTAYTSFVAVDSLKRLEDGRAATVKQPLPLPQGVSDLAVAGGAAYRKLMPAAAPAGRLSESAHAKAGGEREEKDARGNNGSDETAGTPVLKLDKIACTGGLSADEARKVFEGALEAMNRCLPSGLYGNGDAAGSLSFTLAIDGEGAVKIVAPSDRTQMKDAAIQCLMRLLSQLRFPRTLNGEDGAISVSFSIDPS